MLVCTANKSPSYQTNMFKAIGFVIGLIAIRIIMPEVFHAFESAIISFFRFTGDVFANTPPLTQVGAVGITNYIPEAAPLPSSLMGQ